ncbi:alpha/beta hydrolase [Flavobacterium alvei]|uniref:alpha/beta hydrolase n=1 Tax=Flavobacterium alvei TaxID=2080416 RepID=UPI0026F20F90|nr:alpha/beta fold hydrolase [Flavobacterium alvei]
MQILRSIFLYLLIFFGGIYLLYVGYVYFNQGEMIFMANKLPKDYKFEFNQDFEELNIPSFDNKMLNGLLFKTQNPKGLVFYLHGNAGSLDTWGSVAKNYTNLGYDIFILDYRGFGKSEGKIKNQDQVYQDLTFAYNKLITKYDRNKVVIIGYSIGTGLATYLASIENPKKLILQAPYYNFIEFSSGRARFVPDFLKKFKFETDKYIVKVKSPIYIFHGNKDQIISYDNSIRLKKLLKPTDKVFILEDQDHLGMNENVDFQEKLKMILE